MSRFCSTAVVPLYVLATGICTSAWNIITILFITFMTLISKELSFYHILSLFLYLGNKKIKSQDSTDLQRLCKIKQGINVFNHYANC